MKIAYIKWTDSVQLRKPLKQEDSETVVVDDIHSAGLVVYEDEELISLSPHLNHTQDSYDPPIQIPRCSIKIIQTFEV